MVYLRRVYVCGCRILWMLICMPLLCRKADRMSRWWHCDARFCSISWDAGQSAWVQEVLFCIWGVKCTGAAPHAKTFFFNKILSRVCCDAWHMCLQGLVVEHVLAHKSQFARVSYYCYTVGVKATSSNKRAWSACWNRIAVARQRPGSVGAQLDDTLAPPPPPP